MITVEEFKEGDSGVIKHWVNQPQYVGREIFMKDSVLTMVNINGIEIVSFDMRYPHYTKIELKK